MTLGLFDPAFLGGLVTTPAGPTDPDFANVSLLLHGDGTNGSTTILDSSPLSKAVTPYGNAQINTTVTDPFGRTGLGVIAFDGSGDSLSVPSSVDFDFGLDDFTLELWVRFNGVGSQQTIASRFQTWTSLVQFLLILNSASKIICWMGNGVPIVFSSTSTIAANTWYHIAITCSSNTTRLFVNGQQEASSSVTASLASTQPLVIGGGSLNGYIDEFRITKGVARYTSNFPPPTTPFPDA